MDKGCSEEGTPETEALTSGGASEAWRDGELRDHFKEPEEQGRRRRNWVLQSRGSERRALRTS